MENTDIIGPIPGKPPVFTIDGAQICLAEAAGIRVLLAVDTRDEVHAKRVCHRMVTDLGDWLDLDEGLTLVEDDHYKEFCRTGTMTAHTGAPEEWPFTFTVDPAGSVVLYPIPHKNSTTVRGRLLAPRAPALFTEPRVDTHDFARGSDHDQFAHHMRAVLALHRIEAAVTVATDDRTYRAPGHSAITARIYSPHGPMSQIAQQQCVHAVLAATTSIPHLMAHPDYQATTPDDPPDVVLEYQRPQRPWRIAGDTADG
ncbi:hypothetical protein [Mycobacterium hubeiense]|uniref:hypothetical protein n=1 Tax=Mycobacterium hubeiense TaxID=1867256 RepID=UPI000C7EEBE5|nr:hypothetical protein [Mycobacterium sp. QGD 101]